MSGVQLDSEAIQDIAARRDLREPNREALESIVIELSQHYDVAGKDRPMEAVVDVATGVGKTYIMAAAIDYLATVRGGRNFAVVTPGRTILRKTEDNFTPGHPKSLLGAMRVRPVVITSDNFASPYVRAAMDDPTQVKLYIFTVQALTKPQTTDVGRKTHKFQRAWARRSTSTCSRWTTSSCSPTSTTPTTATLSPRPSATCGPRRCSGSQPPRTRRRRRTRLSIATRSPRPSPPASSRRR